MAPEKALGMLTKSTMQSMTRVGRLPGASLLLTFAAVAVYVWPGAAETLQWERGLSFSTKWSWMTSHWVHWSVEHVFWSGGTFLVLASTIERQSRAKLFACLAASAATIALALEIASSPINVYGGLSGVDSALFAVLLLDFVADGFQRASRRDVALGAAIGLGFAAKVGYEWTTGAALFVDGTDGMVAVPLAHAAGFISGLGTGLLFLARNGVKRRKAVSASPAPGRSSRPRPISPAPAQTATTNSSEDRIRRQKDRPGWSR